LPEKSCAVRYTRGQFTASPCLLQRLFGGSTVNGRWAEPGAKALVLSRERSS
jgi:hypothetical protein